MPLLLAQSSLGGAGALPPPAPPQAAAPRPPTQATPPRPAAPREARPAPPQRPNAQRPSPPRPPSGTAARPTSPPPALQRPGPARPNAVRPPQRAGRAAAVGGGAGAAAAAAGASAAPAAPPAPPAPPPPEWPAPGIGTSTGLPLPRFSALASNQVNLRVGPGLRFPVEWRYQRADLPVMILREHDEWRRVRDPDGTEGWLAGSTLRPGRRTFIVRAPRGPGAEGASPAGAGQGRGGAPPGEVILRRRGEEDAAAVARLQPGVIGRLRSCEAGSEWCEVQVQNRRGYVRRAEIYGVLPDEELR